MAFGCIDEELQDVPPSPDITRPDSGEDDPDLLVEQDGQVPTSLRTALRL